MISRIFKSNIDFRANYGNRQQNLYERASGLNFEYTTPESQMNSVALLGSSKNSPQTSQPIERCKRIARGIIFANKNIITGGNDQSGHMAAGFNTAKVVSAKDPQTGKPIQNLVIALRKPYGSENLKDCIVIGTAKSEVHRSRLFGKAANNLFFQEGSVTTSLEMANAIAANEYGAGKQIVLSSKAFYEGAAEQYKQLFKEGFSKYPVEELFDILDDENLILDKFTQHTKVNNNYASALEKLEAEPIAISKSHSGIVVSKGGVATLAKSIELIRNNEYANDASMIRKLYFVDKNFYAGIQKFYWSIYNAGLLKHKPSQLFSLISMREAKNFGRII